MVSTGIGAARVASQRLGGGGAETRHTAALDAGGAAVAPFLVEPQAFGRLLRRALEDVLVLHAIVPRRAEGEHRGVEPHHLMRARLGSVQARPDRDFLGLIGRTVQHGGRAERGTAGRRRGDPPAILRRIERVVQRAQPSAGALLLADGRHHQEIAGARRRHVSDAQRFLFVGLGFAPGGVQQFPRRAPQQTLRAEAAFGIAGAVRALRSGELRGEIGQNDHGEFQALGLVDGHQLHAAALLLQHRRFAGVAAIVLAFQVFHEGAE